MLCMPGPTAPYPKNDTKIVNNSDSAKVKQLS